MTNKKQDLPKNPWNALEQILDQLLGQNGCPWMKSQTHQSLVRFLIEEASETKECLERQPINYLNLKEELGDLLLQIYFHSHLSQDSGLTESFTTEDVARHLKEKLLRRNPHVFSEQPHSLSLEQVECQWKAIKLNEKKSQKAEAQIKPEFFVKPQLSALVESNEIGRLARTAQFDWTCPEDVLKKVHEEIAEVEEAIERQNKTHLEEEIGDLLFATSQWARHLGIDPEKALHLSNQKFKIRFNKMLELSGLNIETFSTLSLEQKEQLWQKVKKTT